MHYDIKAIKDNTKVFYISRVDFEQAIQNVN